MCYDVKTKLESMLKRARHYDNQELIEELERKLNPYLEDEIFHVSGYNHPQLLIYTNKSPKLPTMSTWGLIPGWIKDNEQKQKYWNNTLNARGETIFEKPSFKKSAKTRRCLIYLDGFFEHHHHNGKVYPFYISRKDNQTLAVAGLWDEWLDKETGELLNTFTIITTKANKLMSRIHNNPKLPEPRMPLIWQDEQADYWIMELNEGDKKYFDQLLKSNGETKLQAHTVRSIRGKQASGNTPNAILPFKYEQLTLDFLD